jgi:hypothetical protein
LRCSGRLDVLLPRILHLRTLKRLRRRARRERRCPPRRCLDHAVELAHAVRVPVGIVGWCVFALVVRLRVGVNLDARAVDAAATFRIGVRGANIVVALDDGDLDVYEGRNGQTSGWNEEEERNALSKSMSGLNAISRALRSAVMRVGSRPFLIQRRLRCLRMTSYENPKAPWPRLPITVSSRNQLQVRKGKRGERTVILAIVVRVPRPLLPLPLPRRRHPKPRPLLHLLLLRIQP